LTGLEQIVKLSHKYGVADYVKGGGGNTSFKDKDTIWVKPSGITLASITAEAFVAMDRAKLSTLNDITPPTDPTEREALIKEFMLNAKLDPESGRPSVEAPLHNSLNATLVIHTHPPTVNGMTCAVDGADVAGKLFPEALWIDYIDPGYTLCIKVRDEINNYKEIYGTEPSIIFLDNHGVFISADTRQGIDELYGSVMSVLAMQYESANISTELSIGALPGKDKQESAIAFIKENYSQDGTLIQVSGSFKVPEGPISPDHIVYSKSYIFSGTPDKQALTDFQKKHGYLPNVIAWDNMVFGIGATETKASLALEFAQDGALVTQLSEAFGGINYLSDCCREFIENWEVESYRSKQL
jgi:rhamnose utilization protein RhaD (predicted bifunctional aldolase and dehydrogenase)